MSLSTRTLTEWRDRFRAVLRGLIDGADTSEGTEYYATAGLLAQLAHAAQGQALYVLRQIFPADADGDSLLNHARERGLAIRPASKARGSIRIVSTGGAGWTQANGSAAVAADGTGYTTQSLATTASSGWSGKTVGVGSSRRRLVVLPDTSSMNPGDCFTLPLPSGATAECAIKAVLTASSMIDLYEPLTEDAASGAALSSVAGDVVEILADEAGAAGTKSQGETITITSPGTNIVAAARLLECSGGADVETSEELAARISSLLANPSAGGNLGQIRELARSTPDIRIGDAFVYPGVRGLGTVDVVVWGLPGARQASTPEVAAVQAHLDESIAFAADVLCLAAEYTTDVPITIEVEAHAGYGPDWSGFYLIDNAPTPSTTTKLEFDVSLLGTIEIGDRVLVPLLVAGRWRLFERTVAAVFATAVTLTEPLPFAPANGERIVAGSPCSAAMITAIENYFDGLGPGSAIVVGSVVETLYHRVPDPSESAPGVARRNGLEAAVMTVPGVAVANVDALDAPLDDAFPNPLEMVQLGKITLSWVEV